MNRDLLKKTVCLLSAALVLWGMAGCRGAQPMAETHPETSGDGPEHICTTSPESEETREPEETAPAPSLEATDPTGEEDAALSMLYDDHWDLTGRTVEIIDAGRPTSFKVAAGLPEGTPDDRVITLDGSTLVATGIGSAKVLLDGTLCEISVTPATISLFMITGHSMGAGEGGGPEWSVVGPRGQVYSSHGTANLKAATAGVGIGYGAETKARNIQAFTEAGAGTPGEGSALAWEYNRLTGEKVWVLNTAVSGSNLTEWLPGTAHFTRALDQFGRAQEILSNEIRAGHYTLGTMGILYHNGANFSYKGITFTQEELEAWYEALWSGFKTELSRDLDGDGREEALSFLCLVPIWTKDEGISYAYDEPAGMFMGASEAYPDIFVGSVIGQYWLSDEAVEEHFPEITYTTRKRTALRRPTGTREVFLPDEVHYHQPGYNAVGIDLARNIAAFLRGTAETPQVMILLADGKTQAEDEITLSYNIPLLLTPVVTPIAENSLTFTVSGCVSLSYPLQITATGNGTGTLTVSQNGQVLKTVTFVCTDADESLAVSDNK